MPSGKHRDFDDTWKHEELEKSLKGTRDDKKKPRDKDSREKSRKREDEDRNRKRREDDDRKDRKHRDRENGEVERKDKYRSSRNEELEDGNEKKERSHRRHRDDQEHGEDRKHRRPKEEEDNRERRHRKQREEEDREKRHRRPKEGEDEDRERRHRKHRDEDEDRERRHRRHKERGDHGEEEGGEEDDRRPKRRDEDEEERRRRKERERRHREENGERPPRKHRDEDERRERKDEDRHHRRRDDDEERRHRHEEKKREREREKEEERDRKREEENKKQREREKQRQEAERMKEKLRKEKESDKKHQQKKASKSVHELSLTSSTSSGMTREYLDYLEETYLVEDDFEEEADDSSQAKISDTHLDPGFLACGDNNGKVGSDSSEEIDIKLASGASSVGRNSGSATVVMVPTCADLQDLSLDDEYTGYSKYERFPCPTPAPQNSKTSLVAGGGNSPTMTSSSSEADREATTAMVRGTSGQQQYSGNNDHYETMRMRRGSKGKENGSYCKASGSSEASNNPHLLMASSGSGANLQVNLQQQEDDDDIIYGRNNHGKKEEDGEFNMDQGTTSHYSLKDDLFAALEKAVSLTSHYSQAVITETTTPSSQSQLLLERNSKKLQGITQDLATKGTAMVIRDNGGSRPDLEGIRRSLYELERDLVATAAHRKGCSDELETDDDGMALQGDDVEDDMVTGLEEGGVAVRDVGMMKNSSSSKHIVDRKSKLGGKLAARREGASKGGETELREEYDNGYDDERSAESQTTSMGVVRKKMVVNNSRELKRGGKRPDATGKGREKDMEDSAGFDGTSPHMGRIGREGKSIVRNDSTTARGRDRNNIITSGAIALKNKSSKVSETAKMQGGQKKPPAGGVVMSPRSSADRSREGGGQESGRNIVGMTMSGINRGRAIEGSVQKVVNARTSIGGTRGPVGARGNDVVTMERMDASKNSGASSSSSSSTKNQPRNTGLINRSPRKAGNDGGGYRSNTSSTTMDGGAVNVRAKEANNSAGTINSRRAMPGRVVNKTGPISPRRRVEISRNSNHGRVSYPRAVHSGARVQKTKEGGGGGWVGDKGKAKEGGAIYWGGGEKKTLQIPYVEALRDGARQGSIAITTGGGKNRSKRVQERVIAAPTDQLDMNRGWEARAISSTASNVSLETQFSHSDGEEPAPKTEEEDGADEYDDYEDDFEDYDDDFEDDEDEDAEQTNEKQGPTKKAVAEDSGEKEEDDSGHSRGYYMSLDWEPDHATRNEVDEIKRAMDEENERLTRNAQKTDQRTTKRYGDDYDDDQVSDEDSRDRHSYQSRASKPAQRSFINFVSAKQRQITGQATSKARRRGNELHKLIELDFAKFELFDMPPVSEYDLYMRSFGSSGTRQAYVQTNEDNIDRELQTEEIETREIYTQHPADQVDPVGGPEFEKQSEEYQAVDTLRLGRFMQRAGTLILNVLEEDAAERAAAPEGIADSRQRSSICLSEAFTELKTDHLSLLKDRHVIHSRFSPVQTNLLLTVLSAKTNATDRDKLSSKGVVCVWNVNEPNQPQKVLVCESRPCCCCFSPIRASLAFAGMHDGSVSVWDLREFSSMHKTYTDCDTDLVLRYPTYSTAGVLQYENHQSAVVSIHPIVTPGDGMTASLGGTTGPGEAEAGEGMSFQIATLEENSVIHLWVVAEISQPDLAGSEFDLGLSPGGCVKVIRSSTIQLESPLRDARLRTTMTAFDMQLLPSNNSHFYVATDTGCVIHGVRYGGKAPPRTYIGEIDSPVRITSVDFSPFPESVFLAGCDDGTLRLHHVDGEYPFIVWPNATGGAPITHVRWSRSRPSVFFVLDDQSRLHIWDLMMSDAVPMKFEQIAKEHVTSFDMSNDYNATGLGQPGKKPQMVISLEGGSTEVHTLSREFSALLPDELDQFSQLIQRIT